MVDRNGNAIALGDDYVLCGEALKLEGGKVAIRVGQNVFQVHEVDTAKVDDLGVTDHGALTGLGDDDHTQYHTDARAATWLGGRSVVELNDVSDAGSGAIITSAERSKLAGIEAGAEVNNISDANVTDLTDAGATTLHKHDHGGQDGLADDDHTQYHNDARALAWLVTRSMTRYQFNRYHAGESGAKYMSPNSYAGTAMGSYAHPLMVSLAGATSYISVVFTELSGVGLPDPVQTVYFELWRRNSGSAGSAANQVQLAKTANLTAIRGATASEPLFERLKWLNKDTGADDVAPIALANTDAISVRIVLSATIMYGCNVAVEVVPT